MPTRTLLDVLAGKAALSAELAERIDAVFGGTRPPGRRRSAGSPVEPPGSRQTRESR
jgi:hypothetical protein